MKWDDQNPVWDEDFELQHLPRGSALRLEVPHFACPKENPSPERKGNTITWVKDLCLNAKARIWR